MPDILHRIKINASPQRVYDALTLQEGLSNWWSRDAAAKPKVGSVAEFGFNKRSTVVKLQITQLDPNVRVAWRCVNGPEKWIGTEFAFDLEPIDEQASILRFAHRGFAETDDFFMHCNTKWGYFLQSLKAYIETGKGTPHPEELKL
jgi:uncharacterized protein YndB with AHSA1/START domain